MKNITKYILVSIFITLICVLIIYGVTRNPKPTDTSPTPPTVEETAIAAEKRYSEAKLSFRGYQLEYCDAWKAYGTAKLAVAKKYSIQIDEDKYATNAAFDCSTVFTPDTFL